MLPLPRILHMEVHKVLRLPRILHMEVHKVLRLPRNLHVKKQVNTLITMEGRTGDHRRQPPTTADNATARASNGAWRFTKCCACHEFCTWRFTKCCACHEFCTWRSQSAVPATISACQETSAYSNHNGGTDRRPPQTTADNATARASNGAWRFTKCCACHEFCTWRFTKCCACHEFCTWRFTKCCACREFCTSRNK